MPSTAIFTIAQNESKLLCRWADYYCRSGQTFDPADVYVLNHQTQGDYADILYELQRRHSFHVLPVMHEYSYDHTWLLQTARDFQRFLLASYDIVVFTAVDEFLVAPAQSLHTYLQQLSSAYVRADGYEIVHVVDQEAAVDWNLPLLPQRQWWYGSERYSKTLISRLPLFWQPGFYTAANVPPTQPRDLSLFLLHMHRVDFGACLQRHREISSRRWLPAARHHGVFRHNLIDEPEMLSRWLMCDADATINYAALSRIPTWLNFAL